IYSSPMNYYTLSAEKSIEKLSSSIKTGLSTNEAEFRQKKYGLNILPQEKPFTLRDIVIDQLKDPMIIVLIGACVLTLAIGHYQDFYIILAVVIIEFVIGFVEEYRSEKIIEELTKISKTKTRVLRDGKIKKISSENLVPGDIIQINSGEKVPADARVLVTDYLTANQAILTGESMLQEKNTEIIPVDTPISERQNILFQGTFVTSGTALAIVGQTGALTEFGKISAKVQKIKKTKTPLQKKLAGFTKIITITILSFAVIFSVVGLALGKNIIDIILLAISISVAAIPESFPIIIAIALVVGMARLARKKVIVKHLPAVETLGSTSVIGMDKTGTLTENKLSVKKIIFPDNQTFVIDQLDYSPEGNFFLEDKKIKPIDYPYLDLFLTAGAVCNDSSVKKNKDEQWISIGDPTESALIAAAAKANLDPDSLNQNYVRQGTIPFRSGENYMATLNWNQKNDKRYIFLKGAPEVILEKCSYQTKGRKSVKLSIKDKKDLLRQVDDLAQKSYRIIAIAYKEAPSQGEYELNDTNLKYGLIFSGFAIMTDPLRSTAEKSIQQARQAGLKVIIITGDHPKTALNIAKTLGYQIEEKNVLIGSDFAGMNEQQFEKIADDIVIYARVLPEQKLRIIKHWQEKGQVVAMTGDGVNDAPALKKADIGLAMGNGTDVAKEAAEIILLENDFSRIIQTIRQGRIIYDNIKKSVLYLLGHNLGEVGIIFISLLLGYPLPLLPTQILWMNLVTDGVIDEALIFEPGEPNILKRKPRDPNERFITPPMTRRIIIIGLYITVISFLIYQFFLSTHDLTYARTAVFVLMGFFSVFGIFGCRALNYSTFQSHILQNPILIIASVFSIFLQLAVVYIPLFAQYLHTTPLNIYDLIYIIFTSFSLLLVIEFQKLIESKIPFFKKTLA
ncbi:HAD-IC family P-type ATPase, partial [Patescibacteria group bacterium]|nr:HAD-IC family P-type ATPase [Patescibacteria group bacterium]